MNEIVSKFLLKGDKFISEIHLTFYFYVRRHTYGVSEIISFSTMTSLILLMSAIFKKIGILCQT